MDSPSAQQALIASGERLASNGKAGVPACASCHGIRGEGNSANGFPRLAGMDEGYLAKQLADFARDPLKTSVQLDTIARDYVKTPRVNVPLTVYTPGIRTDAGMNDFARKLTPNERKAAAAYYASLNVVTEPVESDVQTLAQGQDLMLSGKPEYGVPGCVSCHGSGGEGVGSSFPAIAGQPSAYIKSQLDKWQSGDRDNDPNGLMKSIAMNLTEGDKDAIAAYLSNRPYTKD